MLSGGRGPIGYEGEFFERERLLGRGIRRRRRRFFLLEALEKAGFEDALPARPLALDATLLHLQDSLQDARDARVDVGQRVGVNRGVVNPGA